MAIDKRFLYYTSEEKFLSDKNKGEIDGKSIAFISSDGKKAIYTHGKFFSPEAFVVGTQTTSTNAFTGTFNEIEKLYDGLSIKYWLPFNGTSTAATLNLDINGTSTGAIPVYVKGTTRFTTHIGANNILHLTYRENVGSIAKGWWVSGSYDSNSNTTYTFTSAGDDDEGGTFKVKPSNGSEQTVSVGLKDLTLQFNSGGVENTSVYTYNGKSPKTINIKSGDNVSFNTKDGELTISATDTTYSVATQSSNGLMSSTDKKKLDGVASGAEVNQNAFSNVKIGDVTIAADTKTDTLNLVASDNVTIETDTNTDTITIKAKDTTYSTATQSANGLMSSTDKKKLDGIASGANNYSHPTHTSADLGFYKVEVDAEGHIESVTGVTKGDITGLGIPEADTHYESKNVVGSSTAKTNTTTALTNGNVYINSVENDKVTSSHKISGTGSTTVKTDTSGNIVIDSPTTIAWGSVTGKPTTFTPSTHSHTKSEITDLETKSLSVNGSTYDVYTDAVSLPTLFAPTSVGSNGQVLKSNGSSVYWGTDNNDNTWRGIALTDGTTDTSVLGTGTNTGSLKFKAGSNVSLSADKGVITVSATDTTYSLATNSKAGIVTIGTEVGKANGTASAGSTTGGKAAAVDHVHPLQTSVSGNAGTASKLAAKVDITLGGDVTGTAEFDGSSDITITTVVGNDSHSHSNSTITSLDASKITSGTISIDRLPQGALERLTVVADDTARFALTSNNVQLGDTVKVTSSGLMYYVKDINNLGNANGYEIYTAGSATSVPWTGVTGKPTTFTPSTHSHDAATQSAAGFMSVADKKKLDGIAENANNYSHPTYTSKTSGFYKVTVDGTGHVSATTAVVKKDITDLGIATDDVMTGASSSAAGTAGLVPAPAKGEQGKFLNGAGKWETPYTHPTYTSIDGKPDANATPGFGGTFTVTDIATNTLGHVTSGTSRTITIPNTTATTGAAGLMSATDKSKLDGIASGANKYVLPTATTDVIGGIRIAKDTISYSVAAGTSPTISADVAEGGKYYGVEIDKNDKAFVYVPWENTTYSAGTGISFNGTTINNSGVRSIATGTANGTISVNTGGSTANVAVKGLGSAAYTESSAYATSGHSHDVATTSAKGFMSADDKTKLDYTNIVYGTCSTAADTAAKVITISGNTKWSLTSGSIIVIKFSATNTASNPTFNVNSTGAKSIWYNTALITTSNLGYAGTANRPMQFMYDGTQFIFIGWSYDTNSTYSQASLGQGYGTCSTAASTAAKVVTLSNYSLATGGIVSVKFDYDVPAGATMNINSKGAKAIYHKGAAITAGVIEAGDIATFIYSTNYHLIAIDRATAKATQSVDGLMSSEDKKKLDGIAENANNYSHPTYTSKTSGFYKVTVDGSGHVSATTAVTKSDITGLGIATNDVMVGATSTTAGKAGLVPSSSAGDQDKFLKADGSWTSISHTHKVTAAGSIGNKTAGGSVSSTFTGTAHNHTFTGDTVTSGGPTSGGTTSIYSITSVGTLPTVELPTVSVSYSAGTLTINHNQGSYTAGTLPTRSNAITVATGTHTHNVGVTGSIENTTAGGSVSSTFTGTAHNHTFTGSEVSTGNPSY